MNAQLKIAGLSPELLGLESVLIGSLPATSMTDDAPDRHTVEAAFTRTTDRDEVAASVAFIPRRASGRPDDDARIDDWVEEGGAVLA